MKLHPQIIEKEGQGQFVVLPVKEYQAITARLHDYEDLMDLRRAKKSSIGEQSVPIDQVLSELGL